MKKDAHKTKIIFYNEITRDAEGNELDRTVLAVFPEITNNGYKLCYAHVGQHSEMAPEYVKDMPLADEAEYKDLFNELENLGYNLWVLKQGQKRFHLMFNIGTAKYVVNFYDGLKTHSDGSPFYDMQIFKNMKKRDSFIKELVNNGYKERTTK